jgi:hypothetical protein
VLACGVQRYHAQDCYNGQRVQLKCGCYLVATDEWQDTIEEAPDGIAYIQDVIARWFTLEKPCGRPSSLKGRDGCWCFYDELKTRRVQVSTKEPDPILYEVDPLVSLLLDSFPLAA